jgi:hypothetical protein
MATTTNYGWTTPNDTDLVKDGAAAIRTLGSSVDTTTKALNPSTTLGDVEYRSATANTNTRLGIGTTGQVLTVTGGVPTWATPASGGMTLISTTTISNAAVLLSSIPATYNDLYIVIQDFLPVTDGANLRLRYNDDSTASRHADSVTNLNGLLEFTQTSTSIATGVDNTQGDSLYTIRIPDYANTVTRKFHFAVGLKVDNTGTAWLASTNIGAYSQTGAISSLRFITDSSTPKSGTILLYGVK